MYFKILTSELASKLNIVSKAISFNSPLPSLQGIKIVVTEEKIQLTASDMNISIQSDIFPTEDNKLEIFSTGEIVLESRYFLEMIRKIDSEYVEIEIIDGNLTSIRDQFVNFELNGIKAENYPLIDFERPGNSLFIKANLLKEIISQTVFAASDKETRPVLTGLNIKCENNELTCVATDSYRLAQKKVLLDNGFDFNVTIPTKTLNELVKVIDGEGEIEISLNDKKALFMFDNMFISTRLIEGNYPETARLIPHDFEYELIVEARTLLNAINRASFIKNDGVSIIKMELASGEVVISSKSSDVGSVETIVPDSYEGNNLSIAFKGQYVYDAIRVLNAFKIKIQFGGTMKPFIITSLDNEDVLQLVLPIKTYN